MKYIVVNEFGVEWPIVFPNQLTHAIVGEAYHSMGQIVGAGFVSHDGMCYGESLSTDVQSRGELDTLLVRNLLNRS